MIVGVLVLVLAVGWRSYASPTTGTGSLTLPQPSPNAGERAPNFTAPMMSGEAFKLKDKGIYVLTFWSMLNESSSESKPAFDRLAREYSDSGVTFAAVYVSEMPGQPKKAPYALLRDTSGRLTSLYNVKRVPRLFLIKDGRIVRVYNSYHEDNEKYLKKALAKLLSEKRESSR